MDDEDGIATARAYLAQLRSGEPLSDPRPPQPVPGGSGAPDPIASEPEALYTLEAAGADARVLAFACRSAGFDVRDVARDRLVARLEVPVNCAPRARTADGEWDFVVERRGGRWMIVARAVEDREAVASYHTGWGAGGELWESPDTWLTLRWTPLALDSSWMVMLDRDALVWLSRESEEGLQVVFDERYAPSALLVLLVCWAGHGGDARRRIDAPGVV